MKKPLRYPTKRKKCPLEKIKQNQHDPDMKNDTWDLVPRPKDKNVTGTKWF
jgi:hypothetical protein